MTTTNMPYPVTLRGDLSIPPNRWVWIFKWFLLIPHYFVLGFLTIGFVFCWVCSFFAILFTGKYPRWAFDYNVGFMRWSWRVGFYGYQALGTDKYPPFSLDHDPNYPADLDVAYPDKLSQGMVLIKWWLWAFPQWIIVAVFQGGQHWIGLAPLLAVICGIVNLFTGKFPEDLFKFVIAIDRWTYRVYGYVGLMTDIYPPFRLDYEN
jgi:hypothetical protein